MSPKPHQEQQTRIAPVLRVTLAQLAAGRAPQDVAADVIKKGAERVVLRARLPIGDPRLPLLDALIRALAARTFDDSAISLEACLRDAEGLGMNTP